LGRRKTKKENPSKVRATIPTPIPAQEERAVLPALRFKVIEELLNKLEMEYRRIRATDLEDLHNDLADTIVKYINERKVMVDTVLLVLEILRHEMITEKIKLLTRGEPAEKVL